MKNSGQLKVKVNCKVGRGLLFEIKEKKVIIKAYELRSTGHSARKSEC